MLENTPQIAETTPINENRGQSEAFNPYTSCVNTVRLTYPDAPVINASEYPLNGTYDNAEILILKYSSENGNVYHVAPIAATGTKITLGLEGNFKAGEKTENRVIENNAKEIIGYFDVDLYKKFKELPESAQKTILCESDGNHYNPDGSVLRGKDGEWGIAQWKKSSWNFMISIRRKVGEERVLLDINNPYDQLIMTEFAFKQGYANWWTCYRKLYGN